MAERETPKRSIRIIVRPAAKKLKIILILLVLIGTVALAALITVRVRIERETQAKLDQAAVLEQENADLAEKTGQLGTSDSIRDIAKEELGLVDPDTVLIDPNS